MKTIAVSCLVLFSIGACGDGDDGIGKGGENGGASGSAARGGQGGELTGGTNGASGEAGVGTAGEAATGGSAGARGGSSGMSGSPTTGGRGGTGAAGDGGAAGAGDGGVGGADDGGTAGDAGDGGTGGIPEPPPVTRECSAPADCDRTRGASPCGAWACTPQGACVADSPGCTDSDGDGYGAGSSCACAGLDCDDQDASIGSIGRRVCSLRSGSHGGCVSTVRLCHGGAWGECREAPGEVPPGGEACNGEDDDCDGDIDEGLGVFACGFGACRTVVPACTAGAIRRCLPRAPTTTVDGCNGIDDDCDGSTDEDCADCLHVAPDGNDALASQNSGRTPFQNLQPALDFAATQPDAPTRVCVAAGSACGATATYPADLVMRNGIALLGNYESTTWTRCSNSTTRIAPTTARGVFFPSDIDEPTVLDGFTVDRFAASKTTAVTLDGARAVVLANLVITNAPSAEYSYGVDLANGSEATILRSNVNGGAGSVESVGVRSDASRVTLEDNCPSPDPVTGRCAVSFGFPCPGGIGGRASPSGGLSSAVLLRDSPYSRIERSSLCAQGQSDNKDPVETFARIATLVIEGNGAGIVVRGNAIRSQTRFTNQSSSVLRAESCGGATPWVVDNASIHADADTTEARMIEGIVSSGDCHPVIDSNSIGTLSRVTSFRATAIRCAAAGGVASRCVISGNGVGNNGSQMGVTSPTFQDIGIRCEAGACAKIVKNHVSAGDYTGCTRTCNALGIGLELERSGAFIDSNAISGGCPGRGIGIRTSSSWSRIQNNSISGREENCSAIRVAGGHVVLDVTSSAGVDELDVHSNGLASDLSPPSDIVDSSTSVVLRAGTSPPDGPRGIFRNNWLSHAWAFGSGFVGFSETAVVADARIVQNNLFSMGPNTLYANADGSGAATADQLNSLSDIIASGNIDDSDFWRNSGTPEGAPLWDQNGRPRGASPDIGQFEE